jgi:hypothetical protein
LSSSVKNVIASPDLPALPHRPVQRKYRYIYKAFQYHKVPTPDAHMQTEVMYCGTRYLTNVTVNKLKDHLIILLVQEKAGHAYI